MLVGKRVGPKRFLKHIFILVKRMKFKRLYGFIFLVLWTVSSITEFVNNKVGDVKGLFILFSNNAFLSGLVIILGIFVFWSSKYLDEQKQKRWEERKKPFYRDDE